MSDKINSYICLIFSVYESVLQTVKYGQWPSYVIHLLKTSRKSRNSVSRY